MIDDRYMAGFVDGEGSIMLVINGKPRADGVQVGYKVKLLVSNTNVAVLKQMQETYGGKVYLSAPARGNCKPGFRLEIFGKHAVQVIRRLLPHLILKAEQARVALAFAELQASRWGRHKSPAEIATIHSFAANIRQLNARGTARSS
jgi:hypothetical protein